MTIEGVHGAWQSLRYAVVNAINANIRHGQNSTFFKHPSIGSKVWVHEGNEVVDVVHVIDKVRKTTISAGARLSEPYGFDAMKHRWGHPVFTYLANELGMSWVILITVGVT